MIVGSLVLAYLAQRFFDTTLNRSFGQFLLRSFGLEVIQAQGMMIGAILYGVAGILFALVAPPYRDSRIPTGTSKPARPGGPAHSRPDATIVPPEAFRERQRRPDPSPSREEFEGRQQLILLGIALIPATWGMWRFWRHGEDAVVRWLWFIGLLLFIGAFVIWPYLRRTGSEGGEISPRFRWHHVVILTLILVAGFWLRFNRLADIPHDLHGDMASMGIQAREWLEWSDHSLFREGWANIPLIGFMPAAGFLWAFGNDLFALNLSAVTAGLASLIALYLLVWRLYDSHRLAALATAVLAINIPHIHFSRLAAYMDPWPFALFAMFFIVDGLRGRRSQALALAGVLLGIGIQMYYSGRAVVFVLLMALVYLYIVRRSWLRQNTWGVTLLAVGGLIALGPSLIYFGTHWEAFAERSRSVFLFYPPVMEHLANKYGTDSIGIILWEQTRRSLLMFHHSIDSSTQFGFPHPLFSSRLAPLIVLGLGFSIRRWRTPGPGLMLIWLVVMMILGSILTNNAPFWPRLVGILPVAALLAATAIDRTWEAAASATARRYQPLIQILGTLLVTAVLIVTGYTNWDLYANTVKFNARPQARVGRYLASLPPQITACSFSDPLLLSVRETAFQAYPRRLVDFPADAPDGMLDRCPGPELVWILTPNHASRLASLQSLWPGGDLEEHFYGDGQLAFISYLVDGMPGTSSSEDNLSMSPLSPPARVTPAEKSPAYLPDGEPFQPDFTAIGAQDSTLWEIQAGPVQVEGDRLEVLVGPIPGHDAVYDYVKLVASDGTVILVEAEDVVATTGDQVAQREGPDNHWWLQSYTPFSGGYGLVAQKGEFVPVLTTVIPVPAGEYTLYIGSFTGDMANGVFGLGISWR